MELEGAVHDSKGEKQWMVLPHLKAQEPLGQQYLPYSEIMALLS